MAISPTDEVRPQLKLRWRQFTVREVLFAIVAVACVLMVLLRYRPFAPTTFYTNFEAEQVVRRVCDRLGVKVSIIGGDERPHWFKSDRDHAADDLILYVHSSGTKPERIVTALHKEIDAILKQDGCEVTGWGCSGSMDDEDVWHFDFRYKKGNVCGNLYAYSLDRSEEHWTLFFFLNEHRR